MNHESVVQERECDPPEQISHDQANAVGSEGGVRWLPLPELRSIAVV
jgi:hypothetical protein